MSAKVRLLLAVVLLLVLTSVLPLQASELFDRQVRFTQILGRLLLYAETKGYQVTVGDAHATNGHIESSRHYCRLAIDLNLFRDGRYLDTTESHSELGKFWEAIGGTWGGKWGDGNHYQLDYKGKC